MEEEIKILKNLIEYLQFKIDSGEHKIIYNDLMHDEKTIDCINSIENLIKAYKELKEIEESHRKENGELREKVKKLEEENKTLNERNQYLVKYRAKLEKELYESNENYIPVSLVEEKIDKKQKQLELLKKELQGRQTNFVNKNIITSQIQVLQELLEKRK